MLVAAVSRSKRGILPDTPVPGLTRNEFMRPEGPPDYPCPIRTKSFLPPAPARCARLNSSLAPRPPKGAVPLNRRKLRASRLTRRGNNDSFSLGEKDRMRAGFFSVPPPSSGSWAGVSQTGCFSVHGSHAGCGRVRDRDSFRRWVSLTTVLTPALLRGEGDVVPASLAGDVPGLGKRHSCVRTCAWWKSSLR